MKNIILPLLLISFNISFSQQSPQPVLTVKVIDSASLLPLQDANIILFDTVQKKIVSSFISDSIGKVNIYQSMVPTSSENILLTCHAVSYRPKTILWKDAAMKGENIVILLSSNPTFLSQVKVTHLPNPVAIEGNKMQYNIKGVPNYEHMTTGDILNNLPFLSVDDNILKMMGNNVVILINNRHHPFYNSPQNLSSLPPQAIEKIELTFVPTARNGLDKVLNITLKKNYFLGWNGNFNLGGDRLGYHTEGSIGYWSNKWGINFAGNYSNGKSKTETVNTLNNYADKSARIQNQTSKLTSSVGSILLSSFYEIDSLSTIDLQLTTSPRLVCIKTPANTVDIDSTNNTTRTTQDYSNRSMSNPASVSLNYTHKFRQAGKELYLLSQLIHGPTNQQIYNSNLEQNIPDSMTEQSYSGHTLTNESTVELLFQDDHRNRLQYSTGAKWIQRWDRFNLTQLSDTNLSQGTISNRQYRYHQAIVSGFMDADIRVAKKLTMHTGVRLENVNNRYPGTKFKMNYFNLIPNTSLSYNLSQATTFSASWYRDVIRPSFTYLTPYNIPSNSFYTDSGNTNLAPQYNNSASLAYYGNIHKIRLGLTINYQWISDFIDDFFVTNSDGSITKTYNNSSYSSYTIAFNIDMPLTKTIRFTHFMSGGRSTRKGLGLDNKQFGGYIQDKIFYNISRKQRVYASTIAFSPNITLQGKNQSVAYWNTVIGYAYFFNMLKNNASQLSLSILNPWLTKGLPSYAEQKDASFYYYQKSYRQNSFIGAQLVINFAGKQYKGSSFSRNKSIMNIDIK